MIIMPRLFSTQISNLNNNVLSAESLCHSVCGRKYFINAHRVVSARSDLCDIIYVQKTSAVYKSDSTHNLRRDNYFSSCDIIFKIGKI